ncbi:MAG: molybdate ABC transporter substrate-binding protein [Pirellulaceae bacterium]|nr:MAG: molybdate ABC transporter substrate-binding protein [Pirellulaceae bacterium]
MLRRAILVVLAVLAVAGFVLGVSRPWYRTKELPGNKRQRLLHVAAASDLRFVVDELASRFSTGHPEITVRVSYGSSGTLFAQLVERAPFDLFLSADVQYPEQLVERGLAHRDTLFVYAVGRLVLWVRRDSKLDPEKLGMDLLLDPSVRRVAIANPRHAPYGRLAESALRAAGLYEQLAGKLVLGENVSQAAQYVQSGAADAGLISHSLALSPAMQGNGKFWVVPEELAPGLVQGGVVLVSAKEPEAARALRDFILSAEGRAVLEKYGFQTAFSSNQPGAEAHNDSPSAHTRDRLP